MTAKSMDDLSQLTDMVDALVDDNGPHENWSFSSSPAGYGARQPFRTNHHPTLPPGVVALPLEPCFFNTPRVKTPQPDNAAFLTKLFVGNMRFEMTREALRWVIVNACGVDVPVTHVLVHVKAASSNGQPTGCASVYVTEADAERLLEMNQRIFCSATTLYIAPSVEVMTRMIDDRTILDVDSRGKKLRGPKNSMVIERSRMTPTPTPTGSFTDVLYQPPSFAMTPGVDSPLQPGSFTGMLYSPPRVDGRSAPATPPLPIDAPVYEHFPLAPMAQLPPPQVSDPVELFVGGIRYEATRSFVAWMLTRALARRGVAVTIHDGQVRLFPNSIAKKRANNAGCAIVRLERLDAEKLLTVTHCVLCDANGAYFASTADAMQRFIATCHDRTRSGPSHAVVIELRKGTGATPPRPPQYFPTFSSSGPGFIAMSGLEAPLHAGERPPAMPSWMTSQAIDR